MYNLKDVLLDRIDTLVFAADMLGDIDTGAMTELVFILQKYDLITTLESDSLMMLYLEVLQGKRHYSLDCVRRIVPYNEP